VPRVDVTRTYLEMTSRDELVPFSVDDPAVRVEHLVDPPASFFRYLYVEVGRRYAWLDRLGWSDEQHGERLAEPGVSLWLLSVRGAPAGYFELERQGDGSVQIAYFGLLPEYHGRGLGKHMLTAAVARAWEMGATRVWLHTCTLDDPAALPNYLRRGFRPVRQETYSADV
jgi:GNAT superfamily N-acetyltransferase